VANNSGCRALSDGCCFKCGQNGHFARKCQYRSGEGAPTKYFGGATDPAKGTGVETAEVVKVEHVSSGGNGSGGYVQDRLRHSTWHLFVQGHADRVFLAKHLKRYLLCRQFKVRTGYSALQWLRRTPEPIGQQGRWLKIFDGFYFTGQHHPGRKHSNADALSRIPCRRYGGDGPTDEWVPRLMTRRSCSQPVFTIYGEEIQKSQQEDSAIGFMCRAKQQSDRRPEWTNVISESAHTKAHWMMWNALDLHSGVLYRRMEMINKLAGVLQLAIPPPLRKEILERMRLA
jgi:hypothetical protein